MGGQKKFILPKEVTHDEYRCVCGEHDKLEINEAFAHCKHCHRFFKKVGDGYEYIGRFCENTISDENCEIIVEKLIPAFSCDIEGGHIYLCPHCYREYVNRYVRYVDELKKTLSIFKSRATRMKKKVPEDDGTKRIRTDTQLECVELLRVGMTKEFAEESDGDEDYDS